MKTKLKIPTSFAVGEIIGTFSGHPIYESLIDEHGIKRIFDGVAKDPNSIGFGSVFVNPGLVYKPVVDLT